MRFIGFTIAMAMNVSRDKVRNFCKAQGLDGYGKNNKKSEEEKVIRELCKNCGKRINQKPIKGRPKTYCSKECKKEWEVKHPILYQHICYYCGKKFCFCYSNSGPIFLNNQLKNGPNNNTISNK